MPTTKPEVVITMSRHKIEMQFRCLDLGFLPMRILPVSQYTQICWIHAELCRASCRSMFYWHWRPRKRISMDAEIAFLSRTDALLWLLLVSWSTFGTIPVVHLKLIISKCSTCFSVFDKIWKTMIYPLELHVFQSPWWTYLALHLLSSTFISGWTVDRSFTPLAQLCQASSKTYNIS